jgi:hypothetical protein
MEFLELENYRDNFSEDLHPQFGIFWIHFNDNKNDFKDIKARRNSYRKKNGFKIILDAGHYFRFQLWFGRRKIGFTINFRGMKFGEN